MTDPIRAKGFRLRTSDLQDFEAQGGFSSDTLIRQLVG